MSCTARLEIDTPANGGAFTNQDWIGGRAYVSLKSEQSIRSVVVKLQGVAQTVVPMVEDESSNSSDRHGRRRVKARENKSDMIEVHKFLYRTQTVFPPKEIAKSSSSQQFTLKPGEYVYEFKFRIPYRTNCQTVLNDGSGGASTSSPNSSPNKPLVSDFAALPKMMFNGSGVELVRQAQSHSDTILPPSVSGLGDLASVKYYIKVTVNRASMFKINARSIVPFVFLPMDAPINPRDARRIAYVRREATLSSQPGRAFSSGSIGSNNNKVAKFGSFVTTSLNGVMGLQTANGGTGARGGGSGGSTTCQVFVELRYPRVATFVPNQDLPVQLVLLVDPQAIPRWPSDRLFISELSVVLYSKTVAYAQGSTKEHHMKLSVTSQSNLSFPVLLTKAVESPATGPGGMALHEVQVDPSLFAGVQIPDYVCPTFQCCNIQRSYCLEITLGLLCVPGGRAEYVDLLIDTIVQSGFPTPDDMLPTSQRVQLPPRPAARPQAQLQSEPQTQAQTQTPTSAAPRPEKVPLTSEGQDLDVSDQLPSYSDAVTSRTREKRGSAPEEPSHPQLPSVASLQLSDAPVAPSVATAPEPRRRQFGQAADYYTVPTVD